MSKRIEFLNYVSKKLGTFDYESNPYQIVIGGHQFHDYSSHPQERIYFKKSNTYSTAAGRYLLCYKYWRRYREILKLTDFSPPSQDAIILKIFEEFDANTDIDAGDYDRAIEKCRSVWSDLPAEVNNLI